MPQNLPGTLNPVAPGLLSLLGLKTRGFNPDTLSDGVVPIVDLTHWYGLDRTETVLVDLALASNDATNIRGADFNFGTLAVPATEVWWVRAASTVILDSTGTVTGCDIQNFMTEMRYPGAPNGNPASSKHQRAGLPMNRFTATWGAGSPNLFLSTPAMCDFWAPPGAIFGYGFHGFITNAAAGSVTARGYVTFDRLQL